MGYPKYDKEEAKRVYEESLRNAGMSVPDHSVNDLVRGIGLSICGLIIFVMLIILMRESRVETPPKVTADIVVKSIRLSPGKYPDIIIRYQRVDGTGVGEYGDFKAENIYYSPGDTLRDFTFQP